LAGATGIEPATYGFGDRRSTSIFNRKLLTPRGSCYAMLFFADSQEKTLIFTLSAKLDSGTA